MALAFAACTALAGGCARAKESPAASRAEPVPSASLAFALHLTFQEEFDALSLFDEATFAGRWRTQFGYAGPAVIDSRNLVGNGERQAYVDPAFRGVGGAQISINPFHVAHGVLEISAQKAPPAVKTAIWGLDYTSGMIASRFSFAQRYGYFEMRAALPVGKGLWPAFWLLPVDKSWPPEIDIVEAVGGDHLYFTPHCPGRQSQPAGDMKLLAPQAFHTFGLLWTADRLRWYVDGRQVAEAPTCPAMRRPMYVLANLAVGGKWPGNPDANTQFPARMKLDYIRVWQLPDEMARE